jgi:drug/metabolite transporter (DMT)-like permease
MFFWGISFVSTKVALSVFPPMTLGLYRYILGVIALIPVKRILAPGEKLRKEDLLYLILGGLSGNTFYFMFENNSLRYLQASEAAIVNAAIPVLAVFTEALVILWRRRRRLGDEAISPRRIVGAVVSMIGVWMVAQVSFSLGGNVTGYLLMLGCAFFWIAYNFLSKPLFERGRSSIYVVFWQSCSGLIGFIPFALFEQPAWENLNAIIIGNLLFLGIFCSALAYLLYGTGLKSLSVGVTSVFINFIPIVTVLTGMIALGERLAPLQWLGAAITLGGVFLAVRR